MSKPTILTVDDDPMVSAAISRDLRGHYGGDYRIVRATSGAQALAVLTKLALRGHPVALIASDQRMPEMTGIEMLERARTHAPGAKYLLLTAYADTDVAIKAINDISTTTCSSPGTLLRNGCFRSSTTCSATGSRRTRTTRPTYAWSDTPLVRPQPRHQDVPGPQLRALQLVRRRAGRRGPAVA